jgi:hypothetical protein
VCNCHYGECNGTARFKNVNNCLNTNLETSGGQSSNLYLNVVHFFNTSANWTFVAASDSCFPALVPNMCCSINAERHILFIIMLNVIMLSVLVPSSNIGEPLGI